LQGAWDLGDEEGAGQVQGASMAGCRQPRKRLGRDGGVRVEKLRMTIEVECRETGPRSCDVLRRKQLWVGWGCMLRRLVLAGLLGVRVLREYERGVVFRLAVSGA